MKIEFLIGYHCKKHVRTYWCSHKVLKLKVLVLFHWCCYESWMSAITRNFPDNWGQKISDETQKCNSLLLDSSQLLLNFEGIKETEWSSGLQRHACGMDGRGFKPWTSINACRHICRYVDQKGLGAMLPSIQSAGVTPEVNLRSLLCTGEEAHKRGNPHWLWNPEQTSPEVENRGITGPTKRTYVLQFFFKKKKPNPYLWDHRIWNGPYLHRTRILVFLRSCNRRETHPNKRCNLWYLCGMKTNNLVFNNKSFWQIWQI